jgi:hypothetical protein
MKKLIAAIIEYFREADRIQQSRIRALHIDAHWGG